MEIWNSSKFDKEAFYEFRGTMLYSDLDRHMECLFDMVQRQYTNTDIVSIFEKNGIDKIISFLNRLINSWLEYRKQEKVNSCSLSREELEIFKSFAEQTEKVSKEELSKTAPLLTTRTYLEMCRVVYDATSEWDYPEDISTAYLFCEERMFSFSHEYTMGILGIDWDSPEEFAWKFMCSYHNEELWFGGPKFHIFNESTYARGNIFTHFDIYSQWTGAIFSSCSQENLIRAIKMYNALREKQYPVYFPDYNEVYLHAMRINGFY